MFENTLVHGEVPFGQLQENRFQELTKLANYLSEKKANPGPLVPADVGTCGLKKIGCTNSGHIKS